MLDIITAPTSRSGLKPGARIETTWLFITNVTDLGRSGLKPGARIETVGGRGSGEVHHFVRAAACGTQACEATPCQRL